MYLRLASYKFLCFYFLYLSKVKYLINLNIIFIEMTKGKSGKRNVHIQETNAIENFIPIHYEECRKYEYLKQIAFSKCGTFTPQEIKQARRSLIEYRHNTLELLRLDRRSVSNTLPVSTASK